MTPGRPDPDVTERRLRLMTELLAELRALEGRTAAELAARPVERAAVERFIQSIVDLATDVNTHLASAHLGRAPATARHSFELAAEVGALPAALAERLAPSTGLRNILVHRYTEIDLELLAGSVGEVLDGFGSYVASVARSLSSQVAR